MLDGIGLKSMTTEQHSCDLLIHVGRTPLVELKPDPPLPDGVQLLAKLESVNPGGSIKDRPVARILTRGLAEGRLGGGRRLLDSSSGNAGIAYAMLGAALGVGVTLVIPGNASRERLDRIAAHGAEILLTDAIEGYDFALREAKRLAVTHPERYWYADQYANRNNWLAHYETTGKEILAQTREQVGHAPDAFVAGVGTGGTLTGVGRRLRDAAAEVFLEVGPLGRVLREMGADAALRKRVKSTVREAFEPHIKDGQLELASVVWLVQAERGL